MCARYMCVKSYLEYYLDHRGVVGFCGEISAGGVLVFLKHLVTNTRLPGTHLTDFVRLSAGY